jgi:hypothetical protein
MFRRLVLEDSAALFTFAAFLTAASIFLATSWRALRMKRPQVERFENLPFETPTPEAVAWSDARRRDGGAMDRLTQLESPAGKLLHSRHRQSDLPPAPTLPR